MATTFNVDLAFSAKTQQLDQVVSKIQKFERDIGKLKGADPFQGVENSARGASGSVKTLELNTKSATGAVQGLGGAIRGLVGAFALVGAGKFIFAKTAELESQTASLKVLTGELGKAKAIISELQEFANVTPFTGSELIETAKRLKAFGVDTEKLVDTTKRLGDVAGATGADLSGIATAYGQIQAKGRLQGEELLQLQERGINLQDELQKMYKMSGDEFRSALEKGKFSAQAVEVALKNLTSTGGKYANGAIAQSDTLTGKLSTLQDGVESLARRIGQVLSPVLKAIFDQAMMVVDAINAAIGAGRGNAMTRSTMGIRQSLNIGATSQAVDDVGKGLGQVTPQSNKTGINQNLQLLQQYQRLLQSVGPNDPNAGRAVVLQGQIMKLIQVNLDAQKKLNDGLQKTGDAFKSPEIPALLGGTGKGKPGGGGSRTGSAATGPKLPEYIDKSVLRQWLMSQGMGRTSGDFTNSGHKTPNHMLNAMDMGFTSSKYDHNYVQKTIEMERKLRATGAFGSQLFGPERDPKGHKDHLHVPTPGGKVKMNPALASLMGIAGGGPDGQFELAQNLLDAETERAEVAAEQLATSKELAAASQMDLKIAQEFDPLKKVQLEGEKARLQIQQAYADRLAKSVSAEETLSLQVAEKNELAIAGLETEERINQVLQDRADMMRDLVGKASEPTAFDPTTKTQTKIAEMGAELADTEAMFISLAGTIEGQIGSAMSNAISGVIQGTTTVKQAFSQMFISIGESFVQMATQMIAKALVMKVLGILGGAFGGGGNGGVGGWNFSSGVDFGASADLSSGFSFSGGGYTGDAPRSGGVDGEGGFPAILHPQETVVDHSRLRSGMSGGRGGGASPITLNVTATRIGDSEFVKVNDLHAAMRQTRKEAAADGEKRTLAKLQQSPSTRRRVGI